MERGYRVRSVTFEPNLNSFLIFLLEGKLLDESDLTLLHAYTLKVEDGITNATFDKLCFAFPQAPLNSIKSTEKPGALPLRFSARALQLLPFLLHLLYWPI